MVSALFQVALGGAIGSVARYLVGLWISRMTGAGGFPFGVLSVNILGSFLMGVFAIWLAQRLGHGYAPFVSVGLLGGFTTFSAFSLEAVHLIERGALVHAITYIAASVLCSIGALVVGMWLARGLWG